MKWEMEVEEIDAVLEKIWDLHDKLSDAIHSISRAHFLHSISSLRPNKPDFTGSDDTDTRIGFVFVKGLGFPVNESAIQEAKSLNVIRTALENLEDQLEFLHTVQTQQRSERDAAIAHLEQSWIVLALRLGEHKGNKYKVIEEARAFVGDVHGASRFVSPEKLQDGKRSNVLVKVVMSGLNFAKKSINSNGVLKNAALVAVSMVALLHLQQVSSSKDRNVTKVFRPEGSSSSDLSTHMDVLLARG